jgi:hypothetical protein
LPKDGKRKEWRMTANRYGSSFWCWWKYSGIW